MDPSDINPTRTQACPQMFVEENSQEMPAASQPVSDVFIQNLSNLTLNPSTRVTSIHPEYPPQPTEQRPAFQSVSDVFIKNFSHLTLDLNTKLPSIQPEYPSQATRGRLGEDVIYRKKGVRMMLSARRPRVEWLIRYTVRRTSDKIKNGKT
ncbi:developmental pluripotency-associated protein 3-like [Sus scrofa]|uniref:developmental pluripotency-associated protein 3-like n=1 Tax=Sus scrofa TaxID=9823 RepID=UPI000A2B1DBF|nr:developmental pluripotency-associated protein 3-like [Sus scrofa]XP_005655745.2 developmental pluripotency-associated protein 3-like [Sus scrofa]XP_020948047.1 developmental pluripotency-associated protein 3-like [Sus scrofa]